MANAPTITLAFNEGNSVPGAGYDPRIQAGSTFTSFGPPAINNGHAFAFIGKWKAPAFTGPPALPKQAGTGLFLSLALVAKIGDPVPGLPGVTWAAFTDPVLGRNGGLVCIATLAGTGVNAGNATAVCALRGNSSTLEIVAREGDAAAGAFGGTYQSFSAVAVDNTAVMWTALLNVGSGSPAVVGANNVGAWCSEQPGASYLWVREGQNLGGRPLSSFQTLTSAGGSPGAGRGWFCLEGGSGQLTFLATFPDGTNGICGLSGQDGMGIIGSGPQSPLRLTVPGIYCATFGLPTTSWTVNGSVFLAKLANRPGQTGVTPANAMAIIVPRMVNEEFMNAPLVRTGDPCPGCGPGVVFASLSDPVGSTNGPGVAFLGTATGPGVTPANNVGIWWSPDAVNLQLIARIGTQPPGAPSGTVWKTFTSLALPGGTAGPLFTAQLADAPGAAGDVVTNVNDVALYGTGIDGTVWELIREGKPLAGKTVKSFNVLRAIPGAAGSARSYNETGNVTAAVTFTDTTMAIVYSVPSA